MELDLRGPGQVHIGLGVTPGEHGRGETGAGRVTGESEQQREGGLLQHLESETESWADIVHCHGRHEAPH